MFVHTTRYELFTQLYKRAIRMRVVIIMITLMMMTMVIMFVQSDSNDGYRVI